MASGHWCRLTQLYGPAVLTELVLNVPLASHLNEYTVTCLPDVAPRETVNAL
jgi:hypothetical protein